MLIALFSFPKAKTELATEDFNELYSLASQSRSITSKFQGNPAKNKPYGFVSYTNLERIKRGSCMVFRVSHGRLLRSKTIAAPMMIITMMMATTPRKT